MRETFDRLVATLREYLAKLPKKRRIQLAILAVGIIALAIVVVSLLSRTNWERLVGTGIDSINDNEINAVLSEAGIRTSMRGDGVYVPQDRVGAAQSALMEQGLLGPPDFTHELLQEAAGFGVSSEHAKRVYDVQIAAYIRTQLMQTEKINNALVIVNSGETSPFRLQSNTRRATASVYLQLADGESLTNPEAQTIADMVRGAVPGIMYEDISISDNNLRSYNIGDASEDFETIFNQRIEWRNTLSEMFQRQVEQLLSPIFGMSNLRVQPNVVLNFDETEIRMVEFQPPIPGELGGIVRSSEEIRERSRRWADAEGIPGTDSNAMGAVEYPYGTFDDADIYMRDVIQRNYDINEIMTNIIVESGKLERLSISVLINSDYLDGATQEFTEEVRDLVAKSIGVDPINISVQHIPFLEDDEWNREMELFRELLDRQRASETLELFVKYGTMILLAVMVFLFIRTIVKVLKPEPEPEEVLIEAGLGSLDIVIGDDIMEEENEYADIELSAKTSGIEQIERFINKDAAAVAQLLKNWLSDD